ncbi:hypothetical protein SCHPADRAFT_908287 [Schizopora paradoxa]|uniref:Uncharacterized protein n=1 Tax=Schizopora paradoxa TaxID=27342 RepID=A0A0H2RH61_9AGAM|nr:hypothetical protein SCHPADRAFT_908287 [Schizopora paradoxa]
MPKDADGDRVYDPQLKRWIQYKSRSDALLANLYLQHGFRLDQLDLVLKVLQDPGFDMAAVSMNTPTDVLRTISFDEKKLAHERTKPEQVWEMKGPGMPHVVFDLVMDTLKENLGSFSFEEDVRYFAPLTTTGSKQTKAVAARPEQSARQDLVDMTLVHRAWTPEVRRVLRRRVVISGSKQLVSFLRSVYCGPHVREVILHVTKEFEDDQLFPSCATLFAGLFTCCPNIQSLSLKFTGGSRRAMAFESLDAYRMKVTRMVVIVKQALRNMATYLPQLKQLWLIAESFYVPAQCWSEVCNAVASLTSLQHLCVAGAWGSTVTHAFENLSCISPPSSLKTVEFRPSCILDKSIPSQILTWFFLPSLAGTGDVPTATFMPPAIENTVISLGDFAAELLDGETPKSQQAIAQMWSTIRSLDCTSGSLHRVTQAVALSTRLRELTIDVELFWKLAEGQLPSTLEHLVLTCRDLEFIRVHDKAAVEVLERAVKTVKNGGSAMLRNLQRVDFRIHEHLLENKRLISKADQDGIVLHYIDYSKCMAQTSLACHALGVEFKVDTFLDFSEIPKTAT